MKLFVITIVIIQFIINIVRGTRIVELEEKLEMKTSENLSLKRVLVENDLIPKEYVK